MSFSYEQDLLAGEARRRALLEEARIWQLASASRPARTPLLCRVALRAGRSLVRVGALLLRYGRSEYAVVLERGMPAPGSAVLN